MCTSEADVRRALQAWSEYRTSGKQPIEQYERSTPAKRTLATMWGRRESTAADDAGQVEESFGSQAQQRDHKHACGSQEAKATARIATCSEVQETDASRPVLSASMQPGRGVGTAGIDVTKITKRDSGTGVPEPLHGSSSTAGRTPESPGKSTQAAKTGNAFALLMSRAKQPAKAQSAIAPGQSSVRRQYQPNSWKDALRQVAVDPERYDHLLCVRPLT